MRQARLHSRPKPTLIDYLATLEWWESIAVLAIILLAFAWTFRIVAEVFRYYRK